MRRQDFETVCRRIEGVPYHGLPFKVTIDSGWYVSFKFD
jgi:hypothetical protein